MPQLNMQLEHDYIDKRKSQSCLHKITKRNYERNKKINLSPKILNLLKQEGGSMASTNGLYLRTCSR